MEMVNQTPLFDPVAAQYVLGSLMRDPQILTLQDKYILSIDDFDERVYTILFGAVCELAYQGALSITPQNIDLYLTSFPSQYDYYKNKNGSTLTGLIYQMAENYDEGQFNFYYNRLKKFSALRELRNRGFNVEEFYNPSFLDREEQEARFNKLTVKEILDHFRNKIQLVENRNLTKTEGEGQYASKGIRQLFESLQEVPEMGIEFGGAITDYATRGCRKGKMYLYSANSGGGKALPNSTLVPMFDGSWKRVGDVKPGDRLIDRRGQATTVLQIFPQGKKRVYEVVFKDGRTAKCNDEHLWSYNTPGQKSTAFFTKTLREIIEEGQARGYKNLNNRLKFMIPMNEEIQYEEKYLGIDPYVFGAMLGDGSFRQHSANKSLQFSSSDIELVEYITEATNWTYLKNKGDNYTYEFVTAEGKKVWVEHFLEEYPELVNTYSYTKFIPESFLTSSIEDRWALVQGLMDTDGSVDTKGRCSFSTTGKRFAEDFCRLCRSLGMKAIIREDIRPEKYTTGICYDITVACRPEQKRKMFRLTRKRKIVEEYLNKTKRFEANTHNPIVDIRDLGYEEDMTCFYVDNEEHLFLTEDYIVTHNTRTMVGTACRIAYPRIENGKIITPKDIQPVLFITTEQQPDEIQTLILSYISGVNEEKILLGSCTPDEKMLVRKAIDIMEQYEKNFVIEAMPNPSVQTLKALITNYILKYEIEYIFYDYIFTSAGLMEEFRSVGLREDVVLMMLANTLKEIAAVYNVFLMTGTQLNGSWEGKTVRNANVIRGSKAVADKIDVGMIGIRVPEEEMKMVETYCSERGIRLPNVVIDFYKNRRGRMCDIKVFRYFDYGTCRIKDLFATTTSYQVLTDMTIIEREEESEPLVL